MSCRHFSNLLWSPFGPLIELTHFLLDARRKLSWETWWLCQSFDWSAPTTFLSLQDWKWSQQLRHLRRCSRTCSRRTYWSTVQSHHLHSLSRRGNRASGLSMTCIWTQARGCRCLGCQAAFSARLLYCLLRRFPRHGQLTTLSQLRGSCTLLHYCPLRCTWTTPIGIPYLIS